MQLKRAVAGCVNGIWGSEPDGTENDIVVIRVADFDRARLGLKEGEFTFRAISTRERQGRLLRRGDLLLEKSGGGEKTLVGQVVLFDQDFDAVTSNFVAKMTPGRGFDSGYLNYTFSALYSARLNYCSIKQNTGIQNLDSSSYLAEKWAFPSLSEQAQIAKFLDYETAKIDALIDKQRQLIALLNEKRQAVISHAVTKGLNPDAPLRDSGVEWLGKVPAHWRVVRLKHACTLQSGMPKGKPSSSTSVFAPMLRVANVQDGWLNLEDVHSVPVERDQYHRFLLRTGDVLMNEGGDRDKLGRGAVWRGEVPGCIHQNHVFAIRPRTVEPEWLTLVTSASYARFHFFQVAKQSTNLASISSTNIKETPLVVPPPEERAAIMSHVGSMVSRMARATELAEKQKLLLQERRAALISAAVTGKIDVRNWKAPDMNPEVAAAAETEVA